LSNIVDGRGNGGISRRLHAGDGAACGRPSDAGIKNVAPAWIPEPKFKQESSMTKTSATGIGRVALFDRDKPSGKEKTMHKFIRATGVVALIVALAIDTAIAQGSAINGEVKKIDESAGKITLKHGPAKSLGMDEPMTMVYLVKDRAMLKQVKVGDKVQFEAEEADKGYTVTKLQKSK
jgi:Cu(I)/Ag(I) efflux system periplasmic protein CusF